MGKPENILTGGISTASRVEYPPRQGWNAGNLYGGISTAFMGFVGVEYPPSLIYSIPCIAILTARIVAVIQIMGLA